MILFSYQLTAVVQCGALPNGGGGGGGDFQGEFP